MGGTMPPSRLPKSEKEQDFDQMMRKNRKGQISVWEGTTSLKKLAATMPHNPAPEHGHGGSFLYQTPAQARSSRSQVEREVSFGPTSNMGGPGSLPALSRSVAENRRWVEDTHEFNNRVKKVEVGRVFGGPSMTYGLGVSLARQEHDMARAQRNAKNLQIVQHLMSVYPDGVPSKDPNSSYAMDLLPFIKAPNDSQRSPSKARMGPGYMRVDSQEPENFLGAGIRRFGVHKPWRAKGVRERRGY